MKVDKRKKSTSSLNIPLQPDNSNFAKDHLLFKTKLAFCSHSLYFKSQALMHVFNITILYPFLLFFNNIIALVHLYILNTTKLPDSMLMNFKQLLSGQGGKKFSGKGDKSGDIL